MGVGLAGFGNWRRDAIAFGWRAATQSLIHNRRPGRYALDIRDLGRITLRGRDSDYACLRQVLRDGEYRLPAVLESRFETRYRAILATAAVPAIVDLGANIGAASLWFARAFPKAEVIAVEPEPATAEILRANIAGRPRILALEAAIGSHPGRAQLTRRSGSWGVRTVRSEEGCPVITLADVLGRIQGAVPFIVKIDIEGFEADLFQGGLEWLDAAFAVFVEPHDWLLPGAGSSRSLQKAMGERNFELFLRGENLLYVRPEATPATPPRRRPARRRSKVAVDA